MKHLTYHQILKFIGYVCLIALIFPIIFFPIYTELTNINAIYWVIATGLFIWTGLILGEDLSIFDSMNLQAKPFINIIK